MGAWGPGTFENDDAADWVYDFEKRGATAVDEAVSNALSEAEAGYVEAPTGSVALAAAETVAFAFGQPSADLSDELTAAATAHSEAVAALPDILTRTKGAVLAVFGQAPDGKDTATELVDLWSEDGASDEDFEAFKAAVTDLAIRLKVASA